MPKTVKKKSGYSKIMAVVFIMAVCYCIGSVAVLRNDTSDKRAAYAALEEQCVDLENENAELAELAALIESGNEDEYIERIAREKFGYVMPGERVYIDKSLGK